MSLCMHSMQNAKTALAVTPTSPGPFVYYEQTQPTQMLPLDKNASDSQDSKGKVAVKHHGVSILAPIPVQVLGGIIIFKTDYKKETRTYSAWPDSSMTPSENQNQPELLAPAIIYLPHAAEGGPRWFLLAARYGNTKFKDVPRFMGEYVAGFDLMDRVPIKFSAGDQTKTRFLIRLRQFPHANRYLFLAEQGIYSAEGLFFSLSIPGHLIGGWEPPSGDLHLEGGIKFKSREFPLDFAPSEATESEFGWTEGYTTNVFASARKRLKGALFASVESGMWSETASSYLEKGRRIDEYTTRFTPYGRIGLETHFVTP